VEEVEALGAAQRVDPGNRLAVGIVSVRLSQRTPQGAEPTADRAARELR
jgi:hypothetical protein